MKNATMMVLGLVICAAGCGDDGGRGPSGGDQGFTDCGDFDRCQPGQYCADPSFGNCVVGCLSNVNCAADQTCNLSGGSPGTCQNNMVTPPQDAGTDTGGGGDNLAACQAACDYFGTCGVTAPEVASCRTDCGTLTNDQQIAFSNCDGVACDGVADCLGVECISDDDCAAGEICDDFFECDTEL